MRRRDAMGVTLRNFGAVAFALALCAQQATAYSADLSPPFDIENTRDLIGHNPPSQACPPPAPPPGSLKGLVSRYDPRDPTQSKVVASREAKSEAMTAAFDKFAKALDRMSDRAISAKPQSAELNACVMHYLAVWAKAGAALDGIDDNDRTGRMQAIMTQAWYGSAVAFALMKVGGFDVNKGADTDAVKAWLKALAGSVAAEYTTGKIGVPLDHNHAYWAAVMISHSAILLNDRKMFESARPILSAGLASVTPQGYLPQEMGRGSRALLYHQFAMLPLTALVVAYDHNGMPLTQDEEAAYEKLANFIATNAFIPKQFEILAGAPQEPAVHSYDFAWIDMASKYLKERNPGLADKLAQIAAKPGMRPAWHIFLGGGVTDLYNPPARFDSR